MPTISLDPGNWSQTKSNIHDSHLRNYFFISLLLLFKENPHSSMRDVTGDIISDFNNIVLEEIKDSSKLKSHPFQVQKNKPSRSPCCVHFTLDTHHPSFHISGKDFYVIDSHLTAFPRFKRTDTFVSAFHHTLVLRETSGRTCQLHCYFNEKGEFIKPNTVYLRYQDNTFISVNSNSAQFKNLYDEFIDNDRYTKTFLKIVRGFIEKSFWATTQQRAYLTNHINDKVERFSTLMNESKTDEIDLSQILSLEVQALQLRRFLKFDMRFSDLLTSNEIKNIDYQTYHLDNYTKDELENMKTLIEELKEQSEEQFQNFFKSAHSIPLKKDIYYQVLEEKDSACIPSKKQLLQLERKISVLLEEGFYNQNISLKSIFSVQSEKYNTLLSIRNSLEVLKEHNESINSDLSIESEDRSITHSIESYNKDLYLDLLQEQEENFLAAQYSECIAKELSDIFISIREIAKEASAINTAETKEVIEKAEKNQMNILQFWLKSCEANIWNVLHKSHDLVPVLPNQELQKTSLFIHRDKILKKLSAANQGFFKKYEENWDSVDQFMSVLVEHCQVNEDKISLFYEELSQCLEKSLYSYLSGGASNTLISYVQNNLKEKYLKKNSVLSTLLENSYFSKAISKDFMSEDYISKLSSIYQIKILTLSASENKKRKKKGKNTPLPSLDKDLKGQIKLFLSEKLKPIFELVFTENDPRILSIFNLIKILMEKTKDMDSDQTELFNLDVCNNFLEISSIIEIFNQFSFNADFALPVKDSEKLFSLLLEKNIFLTELKMSHILNPMTKCEDLSNNIIKSLDAIVNNLSSIFKSHIDNLELMTEFDFMALMLFHPENKSFVSLLTKDLEIPDVEQNIEKYVVEKIQENYDGLTIQNLLSGYFEQIEKQLNDTELTLGFDENKSISFERMLSEFKNLNIKDNPHNYFIAVRNFWFTNNLIKTLLRTPFAAMHKEEVFQYYQRNFEAFTHYLLDTPQAYKNLIEQLEGKIKELSQVQTSPSPIKPGSPLLLSNMDSPDIDFSSPEPRSQELTLPERSPILKANRKLEFS